MADWRNLLVKTSVTREDFAHALSLALVEAEPTTIIKSVDIDVIETEGGLKVYVQNLWRQFQTDPDGIVDELQRSASILVRPERPISRDRIVAAIRGDEWLSVTDPGKPIAVKHLVADLWIVFGIDDEDFTHYPTQKDFDDAGIPLSDLYDLALTNLRRLLPDPECEADGAVWYVRADGAYDTALLLFDELWEEFAGLVQGELLAAVPARDKLLFTGTEVSEGVAQVRAITNQIHETGHHLVSRTLLIRKHGTWQPLA